MNDHVHDETCNQMLGNLSEYIDGELRAELCAQIEGHLKTCENCRVVVDTLRKTIELFEKNQESDELPCDVKERLYAKLELNEFFPPKQ